MSNKLKATKKALNERSLNAMRPKSQGRYIVWDTIQQNFGVRVPETGQRTFFIMKRLHGKLKRWNIGRYPTLSVEQARCIARDFLKDISGGIDPKIKREKMIRDETRRHNETFGIVAEEFIAKHVSKLRRSKEVEMAIRRVFITRWGKLPISDITPRDIVLVLDELMKQNHPYAAHHALAHIRKLFNWAVGRDIYGLSFSPCDRLKPSEVIGKKIPRQTILTDSEIQLLWKASESLGYPFGPLVKVLLLTGQRLREVANMRWSEIDLEKGEWRIPNTRMKNDSSHTAAISSQVTSLLKALPRFSEGDCVFTTTSGKRPVSGFSKAKMRLDKEMFELLQKTDNTSGLKDAATSSNIIQKWRLHDIRRTVRTHLSALPIQDIVRELVISHAKKGLHKVYDQWKYMDEKREAVELWASRVIKILQIAPSNIPEIQKMVA